ncbi:MAG TPA: DUF883 family protein [Steroidobacteraceae bacterium]|jgi:ElaB/YqjD/DUF883 family membrane-anchored ribosome-binding protein
MINDQVTARELAGKELREVLAATEALLAALGDDSGPGVEELRNRLAVTIADVRRQLSGSLLSNARDTLTKARDTALSLDRFVNERPWTSAVLGCGIGLVLGLLLKSD